ncbi:2-deoxyglucose-6-phosphate phosphatase 2 [Holotrichia oblita]|uniref:2-deoxyglucose-6-phosphate phosphatase 2 n=1 Tax=Holotrichia oblita TaxID=644536 RepID=A0ACB9SRP1_HOLOL|nr:2-deoxyglucose-6-phosphate phosphatase 2 [Holotrichia oblita]
MHFREATHVIFDLDGTLIDSVSIFNNIITEILRSYGKEYTKELQMKTLGTPEKETARIIVQETGLPITPAKFLQIYSEKTAKELPNVPLLPGAERLIKHLCYHGIPMALATSSSKFSLDIKIKHHQKLFSLFHHIVAGGSDPEVVYGKPAPDIFSICASRFEEHVNSQECLVFEDSPNGVKAGSRAGMQVVMVPSEEFSEEIKHQASLVLDSLEDFSPEVFGLPQFEIY